MSIKGHSGRRREANPLFLCYAGNSSCLTKSLDPHQTNLYALSSSLLSDSESVSMPITVFVSDITDLCVWKGTLEAFFSCTNCSASSQTTQQRLSGKDCDSVKCVLRCMLLQRSNYAWFGSTDTPMSKTDYKLHTVISG